MAARKHAPPVPAKLSPPRVLHALPRERLFAWIDARGGLPLLWLTGAPGAGKTLLAASYLRARERPFIWYRLDSDDNDIGQFFATLGHAVDAFTGKVLARPVFSAELTHQPLHYARAWFRAVFNALPRPAVLVFDNFEEATLAMLPQLLATAVAEAPEGVTLLVTCRHSPPPALATLRLAGTLAELPPHDLAFDAEEAAQYARAHGLEPQTVRVAAQRVAGWAAGLCLLCNDPALASPFVATPQALFDYFTGLLYDRLDAVSQHGLLVAALLPWVPVTLLAKVTHGSDEHATAAAGVLHALLERLCTQHLFIERVESGGGDYRLHPLLRDFLIERGRQAWSPAQRQALLRAAAGAFAEAGQREIELDLRLDAGDSDAAASCLLALLESRLALGRLDQLSAWFARLPPSALDSRPALRYGFARLCFLREDPRALDHYAQACLAFAQQGDAFGQQLCAAGVLEWSYNTDSFVDHRRWSPLLQRDTQPGDAAPSAAESLRLLNGRLLSCFFDGDFAADAERWTREVLAVLRPGEAASERLLVGVTLLGCLERAKRWGDAQRVADGMEALLTSPELGPRLKNLVRQQIAADLHRQTGAYADARRLAQRSRDEAREYGFAVLEFEGQAILLLAALYEGETGQTQGLLIELDAMADAGNVYHQRFLSQTRAWHALQGGQPVAAREHAQALRAAVARSDMPACFQATWLLIAVFEAFAGGAEDAACAELALLAAQAEDGSRATIDANLCALQAWRALRDGRREEATILLERAWRLARELRFYQLLAPLRGLLAELAVLALEQGVESAFTEQVILRRRLRPPAAASAHWPWALRIHTLGRFSLVCGNETMVFDGKAPKRPLALLKALIAFGADAVPEQWLTDALWPDDEADAAHDAFNVALHRLRKLLPRGADIVRLNEGCLSLDPALCWIDCRAFEQDAATARAPHGVSAAASAAARQRALALYQGHFLAADANAEVAWSVSTRERMRSKLHRLITDAANACELAGLHAQALEHFRRGLEIDDHNEAFYRGAMHCALRLGRAADGIAMHRRLERMLSTQFGVAPSTDSKALLQQLLAL